MDLSEVLSQTGKHHRDVVNALSHDYPGVRRSTVVEVCNRERYGIQFIPRAERLIKSALYVKPHKPCRGDRHRLSHRISFRVTEAKKEGVDRAIRARGYDSTQAGMGKLTDMLIANPEMLPEKR